MLNQHAVVSDNSNTDEVKSVDEAGPSAVPTTWTLQYRRPIRLMP